MYNMWTELLIPDLFRADKVIMGVEHAQAAMHNAWYFCNIPVFHSMGKKGRWEINGQLFGDGQ